MFYNKLENLCRENGVTVNKLVTDIGLGTSNPTYWKNGSIPKKETIRKITEYFGIQPDYFEVSFDDEINHFSKTQNFYEKVQKLCRQKGISMRKLTDNVGISGTNAVNWKRGGEPREQTVKLIADYFGVPVAWFYQDIPISDFEINYQNKFYEKFVGLCAERKIAPSKVAQDVGLGKSAVTRWKKGKNGITDKNIKLIADYFGVPVNYFTEDEKSDTKNEANSKELTPREKKIADITARFQAMPEEKLDTIMEFLGINLDD